MRFITINKIAFLILLITCLSAGKADSQIELSTDYLKIRIDKKGYITSLKNSTKAPYREFSPADKPSPLLSLYSSNKQTYYKPQKAVYTKSKQTFTLSYSNGSVATVRLEAKAKYFKLTLQSLINRKDIDVIQWGALHTNIDNLLGEIIGVARDTSAAVNYAIGMLALNDNTLSGIAETIADAAPFQYIIHTPDVKRFPLPDSLHEGQVFTLGGNGISDVAFYAHKEPWFRIMYGNAALVDKKGRISLSYQSRDRSFEREVYYSLIPNMAANKPNHLQVQP
ncbi:MAG TPA: hypothetical protein VJU78_15165, partial [Chitinophagaceae bacterium]|nr:hypothetical protein [Chitinophagaceae bacterium]